MLIIRIIRKIYYLPNIFLLEILRIYNYLLQKIDSRNHDSFFEEYLQKILDNKISKPIYISKNKFINFYNPTKISSYRAKTLFSKEPDTINWIYKNGAKNKVFFDIGANVGIYSVLYAKKFNGKVFAFEPSLRNLDILTRNIMINGLNKLVNIIPNPLKNTLKIGEFFQYDYRGGHATATFDAKKLKKKILDEHKHLKKNISSHRLIGFSIDHLTASKSLPLPDLIKIDVDGNELSILQGCIKTFSRKNKIKILIEINKNDYFPIEKLLKKYKFKLISAQNRNFIWEK